MWTCFKVLANRFLNKRSPSKHILRSLNKFAQAFQKLPPNLGKVKFLCLGISFCHLTAGTCCQHNTKGLNTVCLRFALLLCHIFTSGKCADVGEGLQKVHDEVSNHMLQLRHLTCFLLLVKAHLRADIIWCISLGELSCRIIAPEVLLVKPRETTGKPRTTYDPIPALNNPINKVSPKRHNTCTYKHIYTCA